MTAVENKAVTQAAVFGDSNRLKISEMFVFRSTAQVLFYSGAVPGVLATSHCSQLHNLMHKTNRRMRAVAGSKAKILLEKH